MFVHFPWAHFGGFVAVYLVFEKRLERESDRERMRNAHLLPKQKKK